jgi:acetolactate synthase-1/2/3 large subunit
MGKGSFPEVHPLSVGSIGMHGNPAANRLMGEADVLLAVGTRFSDRATANLDSFAPDAKKIHIDVDEAEIGKNIEVDVPIIGDAKTSLKMLLTALTDKLYKTKGTAWAKRVKEAKEQLSPLLPKESAKSVTNGAKETLA